MYMSIRYRPENGRSAPTELRMRICGRDGRNGSEHAVIRWEPGILPVPVSDGSMLLSCEAKLNGTWGMASFVMAGSEITSVVTDDRGAVRIESAVFSEKPGQRGFSADYLPYRFPSADPEREGIAEYFCRNGLFVGHPVSRGSMMLLPFHPDVSPDQLLEFTDRHPDTPLGAFCETILLTEKDRRPYWCLCYMYASQNYADTDLAVWRSKDRRDAGCYEDGKDG